MLDVVLSNRFKKDSSSLPNAALIWMRSTPSSISLPPGSLCRTKTVTMP